MWFLAILFAIPTAGVSLLACFFLFFFLKFLNMRGLQLKRNYETAMTSACSEIARNQFRVPTWYRNQNSGRVKNFSYSVVKILSEQGMPQEKAIEWFKSKSNQRRILTVAASFEMSGFDSIGQMMGVEDYIIMMNSSPKATRS